MIPRFSHTIPYHDQELFVTTDALVGFAFELQPLDPEASDLERKLDLFRGWLKELPLELRARFILDRFHEGALPQSARTDDLKKLGFSENRVIATLECIGEPKFLTDLKKVVGLKVLSLQDQAEIVVQSFERLKNLGFSARPLGIDQLMDCFFWEKSGPFRVCSSYLDFGKHLKGVVRIQRQCVNPVFPGQITSTLGRLPIGARLTTTVRRADPLRRELGLRRRLRQESSGNTRLAKVQSEKTEKIIEKTSLEGKELFEFETLCVLEARSESDLRDRLVQAADALRDLGDTAIENFGCFPSIAATIPGAAQHVPLLELEEALLAYVPVVASHLDPSRVQASSMAVHRQDDSIFSVDLFQGSHLNANAVIVGSSGRGKSVLTGILTSSLLFDPSVRVIKVDVGGSHSRECELFEGIEYRLSIDKPSGLNPFSAIESSEVTEAKRAVLGKFLEILVLEDGEGVVPKETRVEIDDLLKEYIDSRPERPSIDDFHSKSRSFSRKKLLSRWCSSGLYSKAFAGAELDEPNSGSSPQRLRYFNFSQIFQAADPDFAQAGMAAVLAQFNLELLSRPDCKVVLICDETPFFIDRCFEFFKFSMANVRKFGASVILVVQLSQHLVKGHDTSLIENAHHRFMFSFDGSAETFGSRMNLSLDSVEKIRILKSIPRTSSEFLYQFGEETRTLVLRLTPEEYWRVTSTHLDRLKIQELRSIAPNLTLVEALKCLSSIG